MTQVKLFLFWRLGLFFVTYLGSKAIPLVANGGIGAIGPNSNFDFWASWAQWDGGHYFQIAQYGYQKAIDFVFFPLFPFLVRLLGNLLNENYLISGLLISNLAFILFLLLFFKFTEEEYSKQIAFTSCVTFLVFPTSFYAVAFYSESLFLFLAVLAFLLMHHKKYFLSAIMICLASLTRFIGVFLVISIIYYYLAQVKFRINKIDHRILSISIAVLGFVFYSLYLFVYQNDPFKYLTSQVFWERTISDPISTISSYLFALPIGQVRPLNDYFDLFLTLLFLTILVLGVRKISSSLWIFSVLVILIPASTGTLSSMPRYILSSIGTFLILGQFLEKNSRLRLPIWTVSLLLQTILAVLFVNGYWVA